MYFNKRKNQHGLYILSGQDLEDIGEKILGEYMPSLLNETQQVDIDDFIESFLECETDYADLSQDGSILGLTTFDNGHLKIYNNETNKYVYREVNAGTILIDNSIESGHEGRYRFTCAHEAAHWILHKYLYTRDCNQLSIFEEIEKIPVVKCLHKNIESYQSAKDFKTLDEWCEWQANYLGACLLMPRTPFANVVRKLFKKYDITKGYIVIGEDRDLDIFVENELPKIVAEIFNVSIQAASIRLKSLNFVRTNSSQLAIC